MDQIIQNLADPSWWFTGVFFVIFGIVLTRLPILWRSLGGLMPRLTRKINRWKERKILKTVKNYRQHEVKLYWLIGRYWCLATVSLMYSGFLMISYMLSTKIEFFSFWSFDYKIIIKYFPVVFPAYILLSYTVWEKKILKRTIEEHIQWKKRLSRRLTPTR